MSGIDAVLVVLLLLCALRGFWRGFLREVFGFAGLALGLVVAMRFAGAGAHLLAQQVQIPPTAALGVAFVLLFLVVHASLTAMGLLGDRLLGARGTRLLNSSGGALFGLAKGAVAMSFALLFLRLFPVVADFDQRIIASPVAGPMASTAASVLRFGWRAASDRQSES